MFRLKISLTHVLLVALVAATAHIMVSSTVGSQLDQNAEVSLRRATVIAEQTKRMDHFALRRKSELFASNEDLYKYMTLEDRPALYQQLKADVSADLNKGDLPAKEKEKAEKAAEDNDDKEYVLTPEYIRHEMVHQTLNAGSIRLDRLANKDDVQKARNIELPLLQRRPVKPELIMALDGRGVGVAALGKDLRSWYGENIAEKYPIVMEVLEGNSGGQLDIWRWSWNEGDDPASYMVSIVPIKRWQHEKPAGVVITGYQIHDGTAEDIRSLVAGVTTQEDTATETVEQEDIESAPEVAFFHGGRIISSTMDTNSQQSLSELLFNDEKFLAEDKPEQLIDVDFQEEPHYAFVRFFPGQFNTDKKAGVVVMSNRAEAKAPVSSVVETVYLVALAAILIGVVLFLFFYQAFIKPVAEIEETIGEILTGNKDAEFVLSGGKHGVFSSLAQGLNLMSAYLQGKPMPDEEELEGWGDLIQETSAGGQGDDSEGGGGGGPSIQGVQMPGRGGSDDKS